MLGVNIKTLGREDLASYLRSLLSGSTDPLALRPLLEEVAAANWQFSSLVYLWGPQVYRLNRVVFRPLILSHFAFGYWDGSRSRVVPWNAERDEWLTEVETNDDVALARVLIQWKLASQGVRWYMVEPSRWRAELLRRYDAATTLTARAVELEKMSFGWSGLDESAAVHLYERDPECSRKFILERSPASSSWGKPQFWSRLIDLARTQGDEEFALALYRRQASPARWSADALKLCRTISDPEKLHKELERIHPQRSYDLAAGFLALLDERGRDIIPFVTRHLRTVYSYWSGREHFRKLLNLAAEKGWWDLWSAAVRNCANDVEFNTELSRLLEDRTLPESEVRARLAAITGVSREWNFSGFGIATVHNLTEPNALALYDRFPDLLRGPFRVHLQGRWSNTPRRKLIERLIAGGEADQELLDFLASRYTTNRRSWGQTQIVPEVEQLADYYLSLRDQSTFAGRAAAVLGQIPAYSVYDYGALIRENRLARLLLERSHASYLNDARAVADLVEASEIHVMAMAYRILSLDDERARQYAARHLPLLLGTLLRPMQRVTRAAAFGALWNAAVTSEAAGRMVLNKAREALALPDKKYPKQELAGLIGRVTHRWPALRGARETAVVYRRPTVA